MIKKTWEYQLNETREYQLNETYHYSLGILVPSSIPRTIFGGKRAFPTYNLSPDGEKACSTILYCLYHVHPDMQFAPLHPPYIDRSVSSFYGWKWLLYVHACFGEFQEIYSGSEPMGLWSDGPNIPRFFEVVFCKLECVFLLYNHP